MTDTIVNGFPKGYDISTLSDTMVYNTYTSNLTITESAIYDYVDQINLMYITLVGGGGAGALGSVSNGVFNCGGGGGSGGAHLRVPIAIPKDTISVSLTCFIGKGGNADNIDGGDTMVSIICNGIPYVSLIATGGKGAVGTVGGTCGSGNKNFTGQNGSSGSSGVSSQIQLGGNGGDSIFYTGGKGYYVGIETDCSGKHGSGGGGMIPGITSDDPSFGNGGNGLVLVEYN